MATPILVPPLGQTTDTVVFSAWYKQVGESVQAGEPLFAIETDKATLDIEAQASGILQAVTVSAGDEVAVLSSIGVIAAEGEILGSVAIGKEIPASHSATVSVEHAQKVVAPVVVARQMGASRFFISPRAKRFAEDHHVEWRTLTGTGSQGAVVERDVRAFLTSKANRKVDARPLPADTPYTPPADIGARGAISSHVELSHVLEMLDRFALRDRSYSIDDIIISILSRALQDSLIADEVSGTVAIGLARLSQTETTIQVLQLPVSAHIRQVRQTRDATQPISLTEKQQLERFTVAYINLDGLLLDSISSMPGNDSVPLLQFGRIHRHSDGSVSAQISLSFPQHSTDFNRAVTLLGNVVRMIEDPDLLY